MQFRTPVTISESNFPIDYNAKIMSLGSCFAVNMAEKLEYFKFQNSCNPFGIIFNPVSIEKLIERFQDNIIVMSYLDEGIPDMQTIKNIFKKYGKKVTVKEKKHKYALSHHSKNELLFIAK